MVQCFPAGLAGDEINAAPAAQALTAAHSRGAIPLH